MNDKSLSEGTRCDMNMKVEQFSEKMIILINYEDFYN